MGPESDVFLFGPFRLDIRERELARDGARLPLTPKVFDTLAVLVRHHGRLVEKTELMRLLWPDAAVEEANLTVCISALRKVLGPEHIETVSKRGYRFVAPVRRPASEPERPASAEPAQQVAAEERPAARRRPATFVGWVTLAALVVVASVPLLLWRRAQTGALTDPGAPLVTLRPGQERQITFHVGLDSQPDWSPDGKQLVFVSNRDGDLDLYIVNANGTGLRNLTNNSVHDDSPAWSPDGRTIAFQSEGGLHLIDVDGTNDRRLAVLGGRAAWSPDGTRLAFQRDWAIYVVNLDGSGESRVTPDDGLAAADPAWAADARTLVFNRHPAAGQPSELFTADANGTNLRRLTAFGAAPYAPAVSPDGSRILFYSGRRDSGHTPGLHLLDVQAGEARPLSETRDGGEVSWSQDGEFIAYMSNRTGNFEIYVQRVPWSPERLTHHVADDHYPAWSPDGNQIAFAANRNGLPDVFLMPAAGGAAENLTASSAKRDEVPAWAPNSRRLAFQSNRDGPANIYVLDLESGMPPKRLTSDASGAISPAWARDGRRLVFSRALGDQLDLFILDTATNEERQMTNTREVEVAASWSRNDQIAFVGQEQGSSDIYVLDVASGARRRVTHETAPVGEPAWSPDGQWIAFWTEPGGNPDIFVVRADGSGRRRLTSHRAAEYRPAWSPDGRSIAFVSDRDGNLEIYKMDVSLLLPR